MVLSIYVVALKISAYPGFIIKQIAGTDSFKIIQARLPGASDLFFRPSRFDLLLQAGCTSKADKIGSEERGGIGKGAIGIQQPVKVEPGPSLPGTELPQVFPVAGLPFQFGSQCHSRYAARGE